MRRLRFAAALLALFGAGAAHAGLKATIDVDKAWLGPQDDVVAKVTITNEGRGMALVPRWQIPGRVLDADLFEVTQDGRPVRYTGRLAKRPAPTPQDFVRLAPGKSVSGETELSRHYDILDGGEYIVVFRMDLLDGTLADELRRPSDEVFSNEVAIWRDAPVRTRPVDWDSLNAPVGEGYTAIGCGASDSVNSAFSGATNYATGAKNYLNSKTYQTVGPRYTTWFGTSTSSNFNTVKSHFVSIEDAFLNKPVVIDCTCTASYYAYVYPTDPYRIYVCNAYRSAPTTGTDSKAGTLIHEMSHFNVVAGTDDWAYGQSACKKLAKRPNKAIDNADSHEYFAENTPSQN